MGLRNYLRGDNIMAGAHSKALSASPDVVEAIQARRTTFFPLIAVPATTAMEVRAAYQRSIDASYAYMYVKQPAVRTVVDYVARNVAQLTLKLYERSLDSQEPTEVFSSPALTSVQRPNNYTPGQKFIFDMVVDWMVYGNALELKLRPPGLDVENPTIVRLPPHMTTVIGPSYYTIDAYRVIRMDGTWFDVPPADVLHWPNGTNPEDPRLGLSPLETLREVLAEDAASRTANTELMKSGLVKPGYIKRPSDAPEWDQEDADRFTEDWANQLKDIALHHPVLEEGMEFDDFGITPKDAEMLDGRRFTYAEVCSVYGLPPGLFSTGATESSREQEHEEFYADVLPPLAEMLCSYLDLSILQQEFELMDHFFAFDLDEKQMGNERLKALTGAAGAPILLRNEARAMVNRGPVPDGDQMVTPLNVIVGGKPSVDVMPVPDANTPAQDGSAREEAAPEAASLNGRGKSNGEATDALRETLLERRRHDRYSSEYEEVLQKHFTHQATHTRSVNTPKQNEVLADRLFDAMVKQAEVEGTLIAGAVGELFEMDGLKDNLRALANNNAETINQATAEELKRDGSTRRKVMKRAKDVVAPQFGATLATMVGGLAQTEAARQTHPALADSHMLERLRVLREGLGLPDEYVWELAGFSREEIDKMRALQEAAALMQAARAE